LGLPLPFRDLKKLKDIFMRTRSVVIMALCEIMGMGSVAWAACQWCMEGGYIYIELKELN